MGPQVRPEYSSFLQRILAIPLDVQDQSMLEFCCLSESRMAINIGCFVIGIPSASDTPLSSRVCKYDYECPGCQKCCFDCGFKCVDPVDNEPKKGMCPMAATFCPQRDPDKCCVDNDCPKSQRCCLIRCGKMCVDPLKGNFTREQRASLRALLIALPGEALVLTSLKLGT
ncbi:hypothetical protein NDU88_011549 [Pleurodeles waltl]|uniref:WAP domain-containing protein n=1 Tax=Pleurodeles waltl TaxID=8319 RepID=A0AAV7S4K7_PLEWA|nr:hypothetical protein NDU88_011549 [Pleurodeles waltl]